MQKSIYRVIRKLPDSLWLRITFDKNKIENCGFYPSKEEIKAHRVVYYMLIWLRFFQGFKLIFLETNVLSEMITVDFQ